MHKYAPGGHYNRAAAAGNAIPTEYGAMGAGSSSSQLCSANKQLATMPRIQQGEDQVSSWPSLPGCHVLSALHACPIQASCPYLVLLALLARLAKRHPQEQSDT